MKETRINRVLALALVLAMVLTMVPFNAQAAAENLAIGKSATVSNVESGTSFNADKAIDGDHATRWATDQNVVEPWIEIDMGTATDIRQIDIYFERSDANQNITSYKVEFYANGAYETVYTKNERAKQHEHIVLDAAKSAEKVKVTVLTYDGGQNPVWQSVSVCEVELYAEEVVTLADVVAGLQGTLGGEIALDVDKLPIPELSGYTVTLNGADFEQIIAKDGTIHHPLTDKAVQVSFVVADPDSGESVITSDITYTVKGQYTQDEANNAKPVVIPEIQEWYSSSTDKLSITALQKITYNDASLKTVVDEFVSDLEYFTGYTLPATQGEAAANAINFSLAAPDALLGDEGYTMEILTDRINVQSVSTTGNMYGMQTILQIAKQLMNDGETEVGVGTMRDYPRFQVRGLLLDMARKPIAMNMINDISRSMRYYKMNDFQLHLSDNLIFLEDYVVRNADGTYDESGAFNAYEAFRLESGLTNADGEDPTAEDYFITKVAMADFIQSQRELGMNIVPEIDVPAHSLSFTRIWPEIMVTENRNGGRPLIDHFDLTKPEAVAKIKEIFDDYTKGENPTFDANTTVHIGADEFTYSATSYRNYFNTIIPYIKQTNSDVRVWGSLTIINDNQTAIIPEAIEDVQMNIWNTGWANPQAMYDLGFDVINTLDGSSYMVPSGSYGRGGYGDLLSLSYLFSSFNVNQMGNAVLPSGDDQVLGAVYAIWNDNIDTRACGLTESDMFFRFFDALPTFAEKTWAATGQEKGSATALAELAKEIGIGPNINPYFQVESETDTVLSLDFADQETGALVLTGSESYIETPITKIGNGYELSFDITLAKEPAPGAILFETTPEYGTHDIRIMEDGTLGFTRELYDYSFGYTIPVGEKVSVKITAEQQLTTLYINGEPVGAATGKFVHNGQEKKTGITNSTFAIPLERIGSKTNAIEATIDNVAVTVMPDPADDSRDIPVNVLTVTTGDYEPNGGATEGPAELVLDGNTGTIWHTDWQGTSRDNHWIQFELSEDYTVDGLRCLPRQNGSNGRILEYEIQASDDGETFKTIATGTWGNNTSWQTVNFDGVNAKYIRLVAIDTAGDNDYVFASAAEIRLTGEVAEVPGETDPSEPDGTEPDGTEPDGTEPDGTEPDGTEPDGTEPEDTKPEETKPEETKPEETKPEVPECEKDENCVLSQFGDIIVDDWYHDGIHFCVENKIMNGMGEGVFAPNEPTTRAQLVTMLYRLEGEPSIEGKTEPFSDVAETDWFYAPIVWAYNNKVVNGVSDTEFAPNANVTREQVATILYRFLESPEGTGKLDEFPDVAKVSDYAKDALVWAVGAKLITGVAQPDGTTLLDPAGNATRAQIATILMRHLTA